jgi:hypothetical protein
MNSNALDVMLTTLEKLIAAYIPVLKNILLLTLLKYITIILAVMKFAKTKAKKQLKVDEKQ